MKVQVFQRKSPLKSECEDSYFQNDAAQVYGVCDGATPLVSFQDENGHNGAYIASHLFQAYFEKIGRQESVTDGIKWANELLGQRMASYGIDQTEKHRLWCTCIAAVKITDEHIQYGQLGDCMIVAKYKDGSVKMLTRDTVKGISARARKKREKDRKNGLHVQEESCFSDPMYRLMYNRTMANTPDGYSVANGMKEAEQYIQAGTVLRGEIEALFLCSDGLFHPDYSLEETAQFVWSQSIEVYAEQLEQIENERGIRPDDKTALIIWLHS
jgi:serine/threonine protein phosphatase PrpC